MSAPLPARWVRTAGEWPDLRDEIAELTETDPGVYTVSAQNLEMLMRAAGFRPIPETVVL